MRIKKIFSHWATPRHPPAVCSTFLLIWCPKLLRLEEWKLLLWICPRPTTFRCLTVEASNSSVKSFYIFAQVVFNHFWGATRCWKAVKKEVQEESCTSASFDSCLYGGDSWEVPALNFVLQGASCSVRSKRRKKRFSPCKRTFYPLLGWSKENKHWDGFVLIYYAASTYWVKYWLYMPEKIRGLKSCSERGFIWDKQWLQEKAEINPTWWCISTDPSWSPFCLVWRDSGTLYCTRVMCVRLEEKDIDDHCKRE